MQFREKISRTELVDKVCELKSKHRLLQCVMSDNKNSWVIFDEQIAREVLLSSNFLRRPKRRAFSKYIDRALGLDSVTQHVLNMDGANHSKIRKIVLGVWKNNSSSLNLESLERRFSELYSTLPSGSNELLHSVLVPYGLRTMIDLMGFEEKNSTLKNFINALVKTSGGITDRIAAGIVAWKFIRELSKKIKGDCFKPGISNDLVSFYKSGIISQEECLSSIVLFIAAGSETAVGMIANSVVAMINNHEYINKTRLSDSEANISRLKNTAMVFSMPLWAQSNCIIDGCNIKTGDRLQVSLLGCSSEKFEFTFGFGPHYCLGAEIGKQQHKAAMNILLSQRKIRLDCQSIEYRLSGTLIHSPSSVPVFLD